jgi:hypothetical protein
MTVHDFLQILHDTSLATAIREGSYAFPWIESIHVLAIVIVLGTIAIVDLRLIGLPSHKRSARALIVELLPFTWAAFAVAVIAGGLLFLSNTLGYAYNLLFQLKMLLLILAGLNMAMFHLVTQRDMRVWDEMARTPVAAKVAGLSSLLLWIGVVFLGRWVGFTLV